MLFKILSFAALCASTAFVDARAIDPSRPRGCGSIISPARQSSVEQDFRLHRVHSGSRLAPASPLNLHFHVITKDNTATGGAVTDATIAEQIQILNGAYKSTGVQFKLVETTRTQNATWFSNAGPSSTIQDTMKAKLRRGGPADLNVYSVG